MLMGRQRYDSHWEEVRFINGYISLVVYVFDAIRGVGFLVVTWATVVLLGGFVSMIDMVDFGQLTLITLIELLWINTSFLERMSAADLVRIFKAVKNKRWQVRRHHPDEPGSKRTAAVLLVPARWALAMVQNVVLSLCIASVVCLLLFGPLITTLISILGLIRDDHYGDTGEGRANMGLAHDVVYVLCLAQGALFMYIIALLPSKEKNVKLVSQAYGFLDGGHLVSGYLDEIKKGYSKKISSPGERNLITYAIELMESMSARSFLSGVLILDRVLSRKNIDKIKAPDLTTQEEKQQQISDLEEIVGAPLNNKEQRKKKREELRKKRDEWRNKRQRSPQTEEGIIVLQCRIIRQVIGSASTTHILQKLLHMLDSRRPSDKRAREAAARIVKHVASGICLVQFPRGIQCISSLLNCFEEYCRLQPSSFSSMNTNRDTTRTPWSSKANNGHDQEQDSSIHTSTLESELEYSESESESESESHSESDSDRGNDRPKMLHGYKELVLIGLNILWSLAGSEDNCEIIGKAKYPVSKIMAPVSYDLVHRAGHSEWSTKVVERSLAVMLRLIVTAKRETATDLLQQMSEDKEAIATMEIIVTCEECKGREMQMKAMQILVQLCMEGTADRGNLTKMLVSIFVNGDTGHSIRETTVKALVVLFLSRKSVAPFLPKEEHDGFVHGLTKILVGDDDTCRKNAAEILEHLCIHYAENGESVGTLKNAMIGVMPKVLEEILLGCGSTGEKGIPKYTGSGTDVESQAIANNDKSNNSTSSRPRQKKHHKLHVALLSLCVTACDKLDLDLDAISLGEERDQVRDPGECVAISLATKMVQLNRGLLTGNSLTAMRLTTRMVIAAMKKLKSHGNAAKQAVLESLLDSLSRVSETMLDLEGCMVFATRMSKTMPDIADTLDSLMKQARQLHGEIKGQDSEIVPAS
ncbi:hypothetical protein CFC21_055295 [Triticum aestivum]|uniref:Uncharacterized protein n=2 Tax=Triticum aestivum TaxID=4565 RepID=A0A9R1K9W3_WHEAT|nr:uncharacterized protein LOC123088342 [Triticum aestivum]KAF7046255.1 hypothetical protein CFC21_055295 [Triticum aestivum]